MGWSGGDWRRQSRRLDGYDYGADGWYFVTISATEHAPRLCLIEDGQAVLTASGEMVAREWRRAEELRPYVIVDAFVVMPNHLHGIIAIDIGHPARTGSDEFRSPSHTLGAIIRGFKGASTRQINMLRETPGVPIWQRSYYDRVMLSHDHLEAARAYIQRNPARWRDEDHALPDW